MGLMATKMMSGIDEVRQAVSSLHRLDSVRWQSLTCGLLFY